MKSRRKNTKISLKLCTEILLPLNYKISFSGSRFVKILFSMPCFSRGLTKLFFIHALSSCFYKTKKFPVFFELIWPLEIWGSPHIILMWCITFKFAFLQFFKFSTPPRLLELEIESLKIMEFK